MIGLAGLPDIRRFRTDTYRLRYPMPFRQSDVDEFGHINNGAIVALHEDARRQLVDRMNLAGWADRSLRLLVAQNVVHYLAEAHYPDRVECFAGIGKVRRSSIVVSTMVGFEENCVSVADTVLVLRRGEGADELTSEDRQILSDWSLENEAPAHV